MDNDNRYKELKKNTLIIGIANICSRAISFILAPVYSYWMTVEQYGTMDLVTTTVSLLTPILCLDIFDATFRYASDTKYDKDEVASSSLVFSLPCLVLSFISVVISILNGNNTIAFSSVYLFLNINAQIIEQYERGRNNLKTFAIGGVTNSVFLMLSNIIFLILLRLQLTGWLISFVLGKTAEVIFLLCKSDAVRNFSFRRVNKNCVKDMLGLCIPLLPNSVMWWIMNLSDRYMLRFFVGAASVGLYSVANKMPNILQAFSDIFYKSWQTSTINTLHEKNRDDFYSRVFNQFFVVLSVGICALLALAKFLTDTLFADAYNKSWLAIAPLVIGVMIHALSTNIGALYVTFKETKGAFFTSFIGAITNIILNLIFIPKFGYVAAATTTLAGYCVMLVYRWFDIKKFVRLKLDYKNIAFYVPLIIIQTILYYIPNVISLIVRILITLLVMYKERALIIRIIKR